MVCSVLSLNFWQLSSKLWTTIIFASLQFFQSYTLAVTSPIFDHISPLNYNVNQAHHTMRYLLKEHLIFLNFIMLAIIKYEHVYVVNLPCLIEYFWDLHHMLGLYHSLHSFNMYGSNFHCQIRHYRFIQIPAIFNPSFPRAESKIFFLYLIAFNL